MLISMSELELGDKEEVTPDFTDAHNEDIPF